MKGQKFAQGTLYFFLRLPWFLKSLPWPLDIHGLKISFYRNIVRQNV